MTARKPPPGPVPPDPDVEDPCGSAHQPLIAGLGFDALELLAIDVVPFLCVSYATGTSAGWEAAHDHAEAVLGGIDGPALVAAAVAMLRAVRAERADRFDYMSPTCPHCRVRICQSEIEVMQVLCAARRGDREAMLGAAVQLARHARPDRVVLAGWALAGLLERCTAPQGMATFAAAATGRMH